MLLHKSYINMAIPVILDLFSSLYDLPVQICQISTWVALSISVKNRFLANISKSKPQMIYVASQVTYKLGYCGYLTLLLNHISPSYSEFLRSYFSCRFCRSLQQNRKSGSGIQRQKRVSPPPECSSQFLLELNMGPFATNSELYR